MIKFLHRLFNHDKIEELNRTLDIYKERNEQLEEEVRLYKGYKLKYEVTKLYVEDDEALLEILEAAQNPAKTQEQQLLMNENALREQARISLMYGQQGRPFGIGALGGLGGRFI